MSQTNNPTIMKVMHEDIESFLTESRYTEATLYSYDYHLHRFADWVSERGLQPEGVTASLLNTFLKSRTWSNNTQRLCGNAIKSFYRWRYGEHHPVTTLRLPKDNAAPGRSLTENQLNDLLDSLDTGTPVGWRNLAMIALMAETGIRKREVCRLDLRYLNLKERRFSVLAKREVWREGVFSEVTAFYLEKWLFYRETYAKPGVTQVFISVNGSTQGMGLTTQGMKVIFRGFAKRVDSIPKLSPHDLRRTMAMLLTKNGAPSRVVQELGGWSDIRMVERYTRNLKPDQIDEYSPLMRILGLSK